MIGGRGQTEVLGIGVEEEWVAVLCLWGKEEKEQRQNKTQNKRLIG